MMRGYNERQKNRLLIGSLYCIRRSRMRGDLFLAGEAGGLILDVPLGARRGSHLVCLATLF